MEGNLTLSEVFTLITAEGKCKLCRLFYRGMCGPHCCVISLIKAIPPGLLFGKAKEKYPKLSKPPPFLFPIFIINKKKEKMLSGLEDFLHIWKRFRILPLPAAHKPPLLPPPSIPCLLPVFPSFTYAEGMHGLFFSAGFSSNSNYF